MSGEGRKPALGVTRRNNPKVGLLSDRNRRTRMSLVYLVETEYNKTIWSSEELADKHLAEILREHTKSLLPDA